MDVGSRPSVGEEFRRRKRRQIVLLLIGLPFIAVLVWFEKFPERLDNLVAGGCAILALVYVAVAVVFSLRNWRCPSCERWLGNELSPSSCGKCGVRFSG